MKEERKNIVVYGIFDNRFNVEEAVDELKLRGFRNTDISVLMADTMGAKEFAHRKETKAPEGTAIGVGTGAVVGGSLGWLAGIGALALPAMGPLIAAGPIMALLAGAGLGGAIGGVTGALIGMGLPEYEAKRFEGSVKNGGILASIHCDNETWAKNAKAILEETGAKDISSTQEAKSDVPGDEHGLIRKVG